MADFTIAAEALFKNEGGYVDNSLDPGGPTNRGVTLRFLRSQNILDGDIDDDGDIDHNDVKDLTIEQCKVLYKEAFFDPLNISKIDSQRIGNMIFETAVNIGPKRAVRILQKAINSMTLTPLLTDGILGPKTILATNKSHIIFLISHYKKLLKSFYINLVENHKQLNEFLKGWLRRIDTY